MADEKKVDSKKSSVELINKTLNPFVVMNAEGAKVRVVPGEGVVVSVEVAEKLRHHAGWKLAGEVIKGRSDEIAELRKTIKDLEEKLEASELGLGGDAVAEIEGLKKKLEVSESRVKALEGEKAVLEKKLASKNR